MTATIPAPIFKETAGSLNTATDYASPVNHDVSDTRIPTDTVSVRNAAQRMVTDCPRCAWRDYGVTGLDSFGAQYPVRLDETGRELIRQPLIDAWRRRGYDAVLVCQHNCVEDARCDGDPDDEVYVEVRQEAADQLPYGADFAAAAGLETEYMAWGEQ